MVDGGRMRGDSPPAPLPQRHERRRLAHDDVVEDSDPDDLSGLGHSAGEGQVLRAGGRVAAGVVVEEDDPGRVGQEGGGEDAPGLDGGAGQGPDVGELVADGGATTRTSLSAGS